MGLDYETIRKDHKTYYGTRVPKYGKRFFEDMYADRTHFILELLQNAEDAIGRRGGRLERVTVSVVSPVCRPSPCRTLRGPVQRAGRSQHLQHRRLHQEGQSH